MHAPSLQNRHIVDLSFRFVKHYQEFTEAFLLLAFIIVIFSVVDTSEFFEAPQADMSRLTAKNVEPLTRLADPACAQEYALRQEFITAVLEHLLETSGVERTYAVVYSSRASLVGQGFETRIFDIFEVSKSQSAPRFKHLTGMSRWNWLLDHPDSRHMKTRYASRSFNYGFELYDESHTAIGYVGFERKRGEPSFQVEQVTQLRETAGALEWGLLKPLNNFVGTPVT